MKKQITDIDALIEARIKEFGWREVPKWVQRFAHNWESAPDSKNGDLVLYCVRSWREVLMVFSLIPTFFILGHFSGYMLVSLCMMGLAGVAGAIMSWCHEESMIEGFSSGALFAIPFFLLASIVSSVGLVSHWYSKKHGGQTKTRSLNALKTASTPKEKLTALADLIEQESLEQQAPLMQSRERIEKALSVLRALAERFQGNIREARDDEDRLGPLQSGLSSCEAQIRQLMEGRDRIDKLVSVFKAAFDEARSRIEPAVARARDAELLRELDRAGAEADEAIREADANTIRSYTGIIETIERVRDTALVRVAPMNELFLSTENQSLEADFKRFDEIAEAAFGNVPAKTGATTST